MPDSEVAIAVICEQHAHLRGLTAALWESPAARDRAEALHAEITAQLGERWHVVVREGAHEAEGRTLDG